MAIVSNDSDLLTCVVRQYSHAPGSVYHSRSNAWKRVPKGYHSGERHAFLALPHAS